MENALNVADVEGDSFAKIAAQTGASPETIEKAMLLKRLLNDGDIAKSTDAEIDRKRHKLLNRIRTMQREHEKLQSRCDALAEALGACYCWGEDPKCRGCRGRGHPGALAPEPDKFDEYVLPMLMTIGLVSTEDADHIQDGEAPRISNPEPKDKLAGKGDSHA